MGVFLSLLTNWRAFLLLMFLLLTVWQWGLCSENKKEFLDTQCLVCFGLLCCYTADITVKEMDNLCQIQLCISFYKGHTSIMCSCIVVWLIVHPWLCQRTFLVAQKEWKILYQVDVLTWWDDLLVSLLQIVVKQWRNSLENSSVYLMHNHAWR